MPHSVKSTAEKLKHRIENGLRVKGTGVGQKVKGKESERTMKGRYVVIKHVLPFVEQILMILSIQFRKTQTGYVEHAKTDPDVERGTFIHPRGYTMDTNNSPRKAMVVDGRSGRNRSVRTDGKRRELYISGWNANGQRRFQSCTQVLVCIIFPEYSVWKKDLFSQHDKSLHHLPTNGLVSCST